MKKAIIGFAVALGIACANPGEAHEAKADQCYEDEVIVWTEDDHDACVALDDMFEMDGRITWYREDERKLDS